MVLKFSHWWHQWLLRSWITRKKMQLSLISNDTKIHCPDTGSIIEDKIFRWPHVCIIVSTTQADYSRSAVPFALCNLLLVTLLKGKDILSSTSTTWWPSTLHVATLSVEEGPISSLPLSSPFVIETLISFVVLFICPDENKHHINTIYELWKL